MNKHVSIKDICETYQVSRKTVERWVHSEGLPYIKIGGLIRIKSDELEKWINGRNPVNVVNKFHSYFMSLKTKIDSLSDEGYIVDSTKLKCPYDFFIEKDDMSFVLDIRGFDVTYLNETYLKDKVRQILYVTEWQPAIIFLIDVDNVCKDDRFTVDIVAFRTVGIETINNLNIRQEVEFLLGVE